MGDLQSDFYRDARMHACSGCNEFERALDATKRLLTEHMKLLAKMECLTPVKRFIPEERRATFDDCGNCLPCKASQAYP